MSTNTPAATRPAGQIITWLCRLGGMDGTLVDDLPSARDHFVNVALAMIGLGLLAMTSMSYALVSTNIVPDPRLAVILGFGWALLMVTIERLLITSMKRHPTSAVRNVVQATAGFIVRFALAAVIGAVVSTPLVLKFFEREIAAQVQADIVSDRTDATERLAKDFADIPEMEEQLVKLDEKIAALPFYDPAKVNPAYAAALATRDAAKAACDDANAAAEKEAAGQSKTGKAGYGPEWVRLSGVAVQKCAAYRTAEAEFMKVSEATRREYETTTTASKATADAERTRIAGVLEQRRADRNKMAEILFGAINSSDGLAARMRALGNLADANASVAAARLALMLALMSVEIMPVFAKFLRTIGPEDEYSRIETRRADARVADEDIYEADHRDATKIRSGIQVDVAQDWKAKQLVVEEEVNTRAVAVTRDIQFERLDVWKEQERAEHAVEIAAARAKLAKASGTVPPAAPHPAPQQGLGLATP